MTTQLATHDLEPDLLDELRTYPGRCGVCAFHIRTQGHGPECAPTSPADEYAVFTAAVRSAARGGIVHQRDVRPIIRGRIAPKSIGGCYRRAKAEGLLVDTGEREPSNDAAGRNLDKLDRIYRLAVAA